ncbi:hypothetical protein TNCV_1910501 [Trichonephila clavipes]|nr:hypothetical protein TNCV_1910501 [Trichonephila clavipes]
MTSAHVAVRVEASLLALLNFHHSSPQNGPNRPLHPLPQECDLRATICPNIQWPRKPCGLGTGHVRLTCLEFEPSTTKNLSCRAAMHVKSVES